MITMKRTLGYVGMAIIGGLLSLTIHERFLSPVAPVALSTETAAP